MANHDDRWRDESGQRQRGWRGQEHDDDNERSTRNFGDRFSRDSPTRDWGFADDEDSYGIRARGYRGGSQGASGHDDDFGRGGSWGRGRQDDDWGGTARGGQYRQPGGERQFGARGAQGGHAGQGERGGYGYGGGGSYSGSSSGYGGGYGSPRPGGSSFYTGQQADWSAPSTFGTSGSQGGFGQDYREHGYGARDRSGSHDRGFLERAGDEIASWFGDEDAARRREADHRGRGPADYTRSDERIREDANDRLTEDPRVDARHVSVMVKDGELTLNGTVPTRDEKRRAEDCVEHISGVKHVQNNLRVQQQGAGMASTSGMSTGAGASGPSGLGGVASGGSAGASATGATPPPNGNGSGGSGASRGGSATT